LIIYLAIPYSFNPEMSFRIVNKVAAKLMSEGHTVFSPITQGHIIADHLPAKLRTASWWWLERFLPFVDLSDELHIICIGDYGFNLIDSSEGCQAELNRAKDLGKKIKVIEWHESNGNYGI
jgi:hypothetical protein